MHKREPGEFFPYSRFEVLHICSKYYDYLQAGCNSFIYQEGDFDPNSAISEIRSSYTTTAYMYNFWA